jgi:hypothetical protein
MNLYYQEKKPKGLRPQGLSLQLQHLQQRCLLGLNTLSPIGTNVQNARNYWIPDQTHFPQALILRGLPFVQD